MLGKVTRKVTAAVSIALAVTACDLSRADKTGGGSEEPHPRAKADKYKRNPNPKQRYDITMAIADAPGPFGSVEGFAQYEAPDCIFTLDSIAGVHSIPRYRMPVGYRKLDDGTYVGTVYLDAMLDEDYFGEGVCHWKFTSTTVVMKATGAHAETGFAPSLGHDEVSAEKLVATYLRKELYPRVPEIEDFPAFGQTDRSKMSTSLSDSDLFTIVLTSKNVQP